MALLVIYQSDSGQIVFSERVNKNHSTGHLSPTATRLLTHSEDLQLRHLYVDDGIDPATHLVKTTSTGVGVYPRDETNPRWLEPLLTFCREIPLIEAHKQPLPQTNYVVSASADPDNIKLRPGVTIFVPCIARWYCGVDFYKRLAEMKAPKGVPLHLMLYDNSNDPTFHGFCKWFLAGVNNFEGTSHIIDDERPAKTREATVHAVARIYDRMTYLVDTEYILTLEDDVIPHNPNVIGSLYDVLSNDVRASTVGANVIERLDRLTMAWTFTGPDLRIHYADKVNKVDKLDGVSFSCTLWRTRHLKTVAVRPQLKRETSFFATDITLCAELVNRGHHVYMCWDETCSHVEPHHEMVPKERSHKGVKQERKPSTRREVSEFVGGMLNLPTKKTSWWPTRETKTKLEGLVLVIFRVEGDLPPQVLKSLQDVELHEDERLIVYGHVDPLSFQGLDAQFVDDWDVLSILLQAAQRVLWWGSRIVVHPDDVRTMLNSREQWYADIQHEDLQLEIPGRIGGLWSCDVPQGGFDTSTYRNLIADMWNKFSLQKMVVRSSTWVPKLGTWLPEGGYLPNPDTNPNRAIYFGPEFEYPVCRVEDLDVVIGVTFLGQVEMTIAATESLLETTKHLKRKIILWGNGRILETEPIKEKYRDHPDVQVYQIESNLGYIEPMNRMSMFHPSAKYFVVSNNDIIAHEGWFEALTKPFEDPKVALTGPTPEYGFLTDNMLGTGGEGEPDYLEGYFMCLPKHILQRYPLFDSENLHFATCEDSDLCLRLREMGWKVVACPDAKIDHLRSQTRNNSGDFVKGVMDDTESGNRRYMLKRWQKYLEVRKFPQHTIVVRRRGANGDLLSCESALKALRWKYPHSWIVLSTECTNIMKYCPWVDDVVDDTTGYRHDIYISLDSAYEVDLGQNRARIVCGAAGVPYTPPHFWTTQEALQRATDSYVNKDIIALHWYASWQNRRWPVSKWRELAKKLSEEFHVVEFGGPDDERLGVGDQLYGADWMTVSAVCSLARTVVCTDSIGLHIALGVHAPTVCIFGPTKPEFVCDSPFLYPVTAAGLDCLGCHHQPPFPKEFSSCRQPQLYCKLGVSVEQVYEMVLRAKKT